MVVNSDVRLLIRPSAGCCCCCCCCAAFPTFLLVMTFAVKSVRFYDNVDHHAD